MDDACALPHIASMFGRMAQAHLQRRNAITDRKNPWNNPGYSPRQFNALARRRFLKARRLHYLARVQGEPTDGQIAMARSMAMFEWGALAGEHEGTLASLRESREHRRLLLRVLKDFERSLTPPRVVQQRRRAPRLVDIVGGAQGGDRGF
jgi:hypothetical protein